MFAKIFRVLKILINCKFIFSLPQKKNVVVYDFDSRKGASKIFPDEELEFLSTRNENNLTTGDDFGLVPAKPVSPGGAANASPMIS